ncbi:MAG: hypothetical protein ACLP1X_13750 [Polyangiaceae bacterium]|jgi:hypothetical protein
MMVDRVSGLLALAITGCASNLPTWTSAQIGCPADEVVIAKEDTVWSTRTWTARCRGKTYSCSEHSEGQSNARVACKENGDETLATPPTTCQFDTNCRGDRQCRDGKCVAPASAGPTESP